MDFQALIDIVDIIGGIEISIDYTINDPKYPDMNYGYDPLLITAGTHTLGGYDALRFARTRHGNNDMRRAERQQQVLYAIRDRVLNFEMIPKLIIQAPQLWNTLSENLYTKLELGEIIQLALFVKDIDLDNITTGVMDLQLCRGLHHGRRLVCPCSNSGEASRSNGQRLRRRLVQIRKGSAHERTLPI